MLPALLLWLHAFPDKTICVGMRLPTSNGFWPAFGVLDTLWHALTTNFLFSAFLACIWTLDKFEMKFGMRCSLVMVNWHAFQDFIFGSEKI